jgi:hypothetical protein
MMRERCALLLLALATSFAGTARADDAKPAADVPHEDARPATAPPHEEAKPASPHMSWWIEGRPWTCSDPIAPVAREVELACDAAGGHCGVASQREGADRVAAVTCGAKDAPWRLDAEDGAGKVLWSVTLGGDAASRARKAAMWIARAEGEGPPPLPAPAEPKPAAKPAATEDTPPPVTVMKAGTRDDEDEDDDHKGHHKNNHSTVTGSFVSTLRQEFGAGPTMGGRFATASRMGRSSMFFGGAIEGVTTPSLHQADYYGHFGPLFAMGAPYSHGTLGFAIEGGAAVRANPATGSGPTFHAYVKGTGTIQLSSSSEWRPFVSFSYLRTSDALDQMVFADFGFAWDAW